MKGFNIAPQPSGSSGTLPPVAEFIAALQHEHGQNHDLFGSTLSGIFGGAGHAIVPKKPIHQHSVSQSSICEEKTCPHRGFGRSESE